MTQHSPPRDRGSGTGVQEQAREKAQEAAARGNDRLRQEVDRRSTQVGEQAQSLAQALRRSAHDVDGDGAASVVNQVADRVESLGGYLKDADADRLLGNVEELARKRPWVAGGAAAVAKVADVIRDWEPATARTTSPVP